MIYRTFISVRYLSFRAALFEPERVDVGVPGDTPLRLCIVVARGEEL